MTLVSSGTIRMSDINTELGRSSTAQISLDTAENGGYATINTNSTSRPSSSNPASMSEWYGYNHNAASALYALYWSCNRMGPTGGVFTITKNGLNVVTSSTNGASGNFTVSVGDTIVVGMTESFKISPDFTYVSVSDYNTGAYIADSAQTDGKAQVTFTVTARNYAAYGDQSF